MTQPPPNAYPPPGGPGPNPADPAQQGYQAPPAGQQPPPPPPPGYQAPPPGYQAPPAGQQPPPPGYQAPPPGYQAPPPGYQAPPPGYQAPPPGYQAPPPAAAASSIQFDTSKATTNDWIIIGAGVALFIFSFFGWRTWSTGYLGIGYSIGAWYSYWWLGPLLGLAVAAVYALRVLLGQPLPQIKGQVLALAAAVGFVITVIALIQNFATSFGGPGFGIWVCLVVSAVQAYLVWTSAQREPGWSLPKLPEIGGSKQQ